ncbi:MAG: major facilitator superfamily transporter [Chloroflexi bacterium]|nr:major facilitator superfamily transporter [Chloroflexota bacterium]
MAALTFNSTQEIDEQQYKRRVWAWTMYDWANSAFATTILAAVLPIYFSQVAGANLPSATVATSYWSFGLSLSLLFIAILSPILGTISDIQRGKKRFLAIFAGIGILATAMLVLVSTGDWVLASIFGILGRIGFSGANTFYDALLPHVAREDDRDRVSARGYAMGYLGGGILLAINIVMIQVFPGTWGARLSFVSVAIWWAVFSIPLFRHVPEPPAATEKLAPGVGVVSASFKRLSETLKDIRQYRELFKYLLAFLIYNDAIGTIIGVAAIYGAELGFGSVELILALLLVQFVGIPYSLIFGRLPGTSHRRSFYLAFVLFNLVALPLVGIAGARLLPADTSGAPGAPYPNTANASGQGIYTAEDPALTYQGSWQMVTVPADEIGADQDVVYAATDQTTAEYRFAFNGQRIKITYSLGPQHGIWAVYLDGQPYLDPDSGEAFTIDGYNSTLRYEVTQTFQTQESGEHTLNLVNTEGRNPDSQGNVMSVGQVEVLPPARQSNLLFVIGLIVITELVGLALALLLGKPLFSGLAAKLDTQRSILLALVIYTVIAIWGFFLDSVIEFWFLAWMVAVVQGGSQALSRSLYAAMSPSYKSGEFFGLFGIMEKFSAIVGPLTFAAAGVIFGSSRPAVLSLVLFFIVGGYILMRVNVPEGKRVARQDDAQYLAKQAEA